MDNIIYNYDFTEEDKINWKTLQGICEKEKLYEGKISNLIGSLNSVTNSDQVETIFKEVDSLLSAKNAIMDDPAMMSWIEKIICVLDKAMALYKSSSRELKDNFIYEFNFYIETPFVRVSRVNSDKAMAMFNDNFKASQNLTKPLWYLGIDVGNWDSERISFCSRYSS